MSTAATSARLREELVARLVASGAIRSDAVREAFAAVPRELFVPQVAALRGLAAVYADQHLIIQEGDGIPTSSSSQPSIMAMMLEALDLHPGQRVLEIGLGTGYNAALLYHLVGPHGSVVSIDIDPGLVTEANTALATGGYPVTTIATDGRDGHPDGGPYDRIIVTASTTSIPHTWWQQLHPTGLLLVPLRIHAMQLIPVLARTDTGFRSQHLIPGGFMPMRTRTASGITILDGQPTLTLRVNLPGQPPADISASGPALANLSTPVLGNLAGRLLQPATRHSIDPVPAWPVIWHTVATVEPRRQLSVYANTGGARFGLVDLRTGTCSLFVATRDGGTWSTNTIESYGPYPDGPAELTERITRWANTGSPEFEQFTLTVDYPPTQALTDADRTILGQNHTLRLNWTTGSL